MGISILLAIQALIAVWGINRITRARKRFFPEYKKSWQAQIWGLILIVVSTLCFAGLQLATPSLTTIVFLVSMYAAGIFLFSAGFARWLAPISDSVNERKMQWKRLSFLKNLNLKLSSQSEIKHIAGVALQEISQQMPFKAGAVYYRQILSREMVLADSFGVLQKDLPQSMEKNEWLKFCETSGSVTGSLVHLNMHSNLTFTGAKAVYLQNNSKIVGLALLWPQDSANGNLFSDPSLLEFWSNTLANAIYNYRNQEKEAVREKTFEAMSRVGNLLENQESLESALPQLAKMTREVVNYDVLCLAVMDKSGKNMERYTVGTSGNLLWEKGSSWSACGTVVGRVFKTRQMVIDSDWDDSRQKEEEKIPILQSCRSRLALPLKSQKRVLGVIILGNHQPHRYHLVQGRMIEIVFHHLTQFLAIRELEENVAVRDKLLNLLEKFATHLDQHSLLEERLKSITQGLSTSLPVSSCRISILTPDQSRLKTVSEYSLRNQIREATPEQTFSLVDLPWHRLALESKRAMLVNQSNPEGMMPESEIKSAFSRPINSAVLVPLVVGEKAIGMLSLAEERDWNRRPFTGPEIQAAELAAEQLANLIGQSLWQERPAAVQTSDATEKRLNLLRKTISDPLTTIMGASELLLVRKEQLEPDLLRYAYIIQKMSERIKDSINCVSEPVIRQAEGVDF